MKKIPKRTIDSEIQDLLDGMEKMTNVDEDYVRAVNCLKILVETKKNNVKLEWRDILAAGVVIGQILIIVAHERFDVITSKAIGFVGKKLF